VPNNPHVVEEKSRTRALNSSAFSGNAEVLARAPPADNVGPFDCDSIGRELRNVAEFWNVRPVPREHHPAVRINFNLPYRAEPTGLFEPEFQAANAAE